MRTKGFLNWAIPSALVCAAGTALATNPPTMDGTRDTEYGASLASQISSVISIFSPPFALSLSVNNSNVGGVAPLVAGDILTDPGAVATGFELRIPLAEAGWNGTDPIRVCAFINGSNSDFVSNQVSGGLDPLAVLPAPPNIGGGAPELFDFGGPDATPAPGFDYSSGNQYVTVTQVQSNATVTIDGVLDGTLDGAPYGTFLYENLLNPTGFGDNTDPAVDTASGSEIDAIRAFRDDLGTPGTGDDVLYLHIAGNLQTNFNKMEVFLDVFTGGPNQNPLPIAPAPNYAGLNNMRGSGFDAVFAPDYYIRYTNGGSPVSHFMDCVELGNAGATGGGIKASNNPATVATGPNGAGPIQGTIDNSNVGGVSFDGGGTGVDAAFISNPNAVVTGVEFSLDLGALGWDGVSAIRVGGFLSQGDLISNQVIGGVPDDTNNLGLGSVVDFSALAGNQYVEFTPSISGTAPVIDGSVDGGVSSTIYTLRYANNAGGTGNSTNLGDATSSFPSAGGKGNPNGAEIDGLWTAVSNNGDADPLTNTLHCVVTGNINDFRRLAVFFDVKAGGQNELRNDSPDVSSNYFNNMAGLTWDSAFAPDFAIVYNLGRTGDGADTLPNTEDDEVSHFCDGVELLTNGSVDVDGPPNGGFFGGGLASANIVGNLVSRTGFGNNTDPDAFLANGSEADAIRFFLSQSEPALYVHVSGNLEPNFTRLDLYFDILPFDEIGGTGGQNTLIYDGDPLEIEDPPGSGTFIPNPDYTGNPNIDGNRLNNMGGPFPIPGTDPQEFEPGFTFDDGFTADYFVYVTAGNVSVLGEPEWYGGIARLRDALPENPDDLGNPDPGKATEWGSANASSGGFFSNPFTTAQLWIDNSNVLGVAGGTDQYEPADSPPANVTTGIELRIPLDELDILVEDGFGGYVDWDGTTPFKVTALINGEFRSYMSNQLLPPVCAPELANPRVINLETQHLDDQFALLTLSGNGQTYTNSAVNLTACVEPIGACCLDGNCTDNVLESVCLADLGAVFQGDGTTCLSDPCPQAEGACCIGVSCLIATESDCTTLFSGIYQGDGTNCDINPCQPVDPTGACCFSCTGGAPSAPCPDASGPAVGCVEVTAAACAAAGGLYVGDNSTCSQGVGGPCDCAGDINNDGNCNAADFTILAGSFGLGTPNCRSHAQGDLNCDGIVNAADFTILAGNFGCTRN
jgi:hypothetical protein